MIMSYVNVGALVTGRPVPTKKALKEALSQDLTSVEFYSTSHMGPQHNGPVTELTPGVVLTVCGPDPERKRNWWASVKIDAAGQVFMDDKKIKPAV